MARAPGTGCASSTWIKSRGVSDVLMLVCDGLKGLPKAVDAARPRTLVQTCVVHLLRNSFRCAARQDWDKIAKLLKPVYTAPTEEAALVCCGGRDGDAGDLVPDGEAGGHLSRERVATEHGFAGLKDWRFLTRVRTNTRYATALLRALLVRTNAEVQR